jgi:hypothetical protein
VKCNRKLEWAKCHYPIVNNWNTIINVWSMQKAHFRKVMWDPKK